MEWRHTLLIFLCGKLLLFSSPRSAEIFHKKKLATQKCCILQTIIPLFANCYSFILCLDGKKILFSFSTACVFLSFFTFSETRYRRGAKSAKGDQIYKGGPNLQGRTKSARRFELGISGYLGVQTRGGPNPWGSKPVGVQTRGDPNPWGSKPVGIQARGGPNPLGHRLTD